MEKSWLKLAERILTSRQYELIDTANNNPVKSNYGSNTVEVLDTQSAQILIRVALVLNEKNYQTFIHLPIKSALVFAWKQVKK